MIQYQSTSYMCAKAFWSSQDAQVLWVIRTCRSWITPEHEQTISRKRKKNNLKKSFGFRRSLKALSLWYPFGSALSADHVRTVLIFVNSDSDSWISVQIEAILKGWPAHFSDADVSCRFRRSATNAAKRLPERVVCKKNTRQICPSSLRTDRLLPVSHKNSDLQSPSQKNAMTTSNNLVALI